jgi:hypothetical protein
MITEALQPLHQKFNDSKRQKQYLPIMIFFLKVEKKLSIIEDPSHQHLQLTSSSHYHFRLLDHPHFLKKMILMTLLPLGQKFNSKSQHLNAYSVTQFHLLIVVTVLSS